MQNTDIPNKEVYSSPSYPLAIARDMRGISV